MHPLSISMQQETRIPEKKRKQAQPMSGVLNQAVQSKDTELPADTLITDHREILDIMIPILDDAQHVTHTHNTTKSMDILKRMKEARDKCNRNVFPRILFRAYLTVFQSTEKSSRYVENLLDFIYVLCITFDKEEAEQDGKVSNTFSRVILRCCTKHHPDERVPVRLNITHLAVKLLDSFASIDDLDQKFQDKLKDMLMHRVKDKNAQLRAYGVMGLKHFQLEEDPSKCQVTKVLSFHCQSDPNPEVRRSALKSLQVNGQTKEYILDKVTDVSELVRLSAQTNLTSRVSMDVVSLDEREKILQVGLTDTSSKVRKRASLLVDAWLKSYNDDVIVFLSKLDVVSNRKVCYLALDQIFKEVTTESFKKVDLSLWGNDKLIPMEKLTEEVSFFWKYVVGKFRNIAYCAELILPSTHDLCTYLLKYFEVYQENYSETHGASVLEQLLQILAITSELCEEGGRREILELIQSAFDFQYLDAVHVRVLMGIFYKLRVQNVDHAFFELIQNMLSASRKPKESNSRKVRTEEPNELTADERHKLMVEAAEILGKKVDVSREKEDALLANDFITAQNLQLELNQLNKEYEAIKSLLRPKFIPLKTVVIPPPRGAAKFLRQTESVRIETPPPPVRQEEEEMMDEGETPPKPTDYFPAALEIAFAAFMEHVQRQPKLSDSAQTFFDTFIVTSIVNDSERVRELVILIMGLVGLGNRDEAKKVMLICLQALVYDQDRIRVAAYRVIFDLVLHYGFDYFEDARIQNVASERGRNVNLNNSLLIDDGAQSLKMHVMDQLNSTNQDLVRIGATGLVKLTLANRVASVKIIIRLLTMWSNPVYENSKLARDLSMWLPLFARMGEEQAFQIAESLVPTMQKLIYAGRQSPLADASPEKLVSFAATSTTVDALEKSMKTPATVHERMIHSVLNEMSNLGPCPELPIFAKTLKFFGVRGLGAKALENILKKVVRMMQLANNKGVTQSLKAFQNYLNGEFLLVADKQMSADDTASHHGSEEEGESSEESVHISDDSEEEEECQMDEEPVVEK